MAELPLPPWPDDPSIQTLNYVCNSRCTFCFIERELGMGLSDTPPETVNAVFATNRGRGERRFRRLIVSGAEATLRKDLGEIAGRGLREGGFEAVRLQTNGRRLADAAYCAALVEAGISEFFVSVHAPDAALDGRLTGAPRSFDQMRAGLASIRAAGARLITNTCITAGNAPVLPDIARFLLAEGVREARFWAFVEFGDIGQSDEHVDFTAAAEPLQEALGLLRAGGVDVRVSWFPVCLLGPHGDVVDNHRSFTVIHDEFRSRLQRSSSFGCAHAETCSRFPRDCVGLHERYVQRFGDHADRLVPFARAGRGAGRITEAS